MEKYIFEYPFEVRDYECDMQGIVNNAVYLNYLEHTRHRFLLQAGCDFASLHPQGIDPVVKRMEIDYKQSLRSGDRFVSKLNLKREGIRFVFYQDIYILPEMKLSVKARIEIACVINGKISKGEELIPLFKEYL